MKFLTAQPGDTVVLAASPTVPEPVHVWDRREIAAVNAALAAKRPLLVRGEPGIGKSQLARAAAKSLGRTFVPCVVDSRTESRDLLWHYDAVARLADAQLMGALGEARRPSQSSSRASPRLRSSRSSASSRLAVRNYLQPRPLWWAFDWPNALAQAMKVGQKPPSQADGGDPSKGCLVLIDEIDKAESDVPNGLLEALGSGSFAPPDMEKPVEAKGEPPLVIITTNEERALPDAFIRRCLVLHLRLPEQRDELIAHLLARALAHFPQARFPQATDDLLRRAAELLVQDRETARREHWLPLPGQAEYLDLVRAVLGLDDEQGLADGYAAATLLEQVSGFVLAKHPDAFKRRPEPGK
jgi:MoxR-like ATPase